MRARFEPRRQSLFAANLDGLCSVAVASLKTGQRQLNGAILVRLYKHVILLPLNYVRYQKLSDQQALFTVQDLHKPRLGRSLILKISPFKRLKPQYHKNDYNMIAHTLNCMQN